MFWSRVRSWLRAVAGRSRIEHEMDAELRFHIEAFAEDLVRSGVPREEALRRARIEFGGIERTKEECRDARGVRYLESLWQDLRFGVRMLRKGPRFTATAVVALAIGIGVNTAVFTAFDAVALRPRPVEDPDHLVVVYRTAQGESYGAFSYPDYIYYRDHTKTLSDLAMWSGETNVTTPDLSVAGAENLPPVAGAFGFHLPKLLKGGVQRLTCMFVSGNYFQLLGAQPAAGRLFLPEDDKIGAPPVVILSGNFWQSQLHSNLGVVGSTIRLDHVAFTIVGVTPVDYLGTETRIPVMWAPTAARPLLGDGTRESLDNRNVPSGIVYGHLKAGIFLPDAQAEFHVLAEQLRAGYPDVERDNGVRVISERTFGGIDSEAWPIVAATMSAVALLLLIACANVASLLLARAATRRREIGVRLSLGAGRRRLLQQLLVESALVALLAGAVGLPLASWTLHLVVVEVASAIPSYEGAIALKVTPDIRIFGYTVLISLLTGVAFGLTPALQALRTDVNSALKDSGSVLGQQLSKSRLRDMLIVAQVAACLVLLINSALLLRGSQRALRVDPGFDSKHVVHLSLRKSYDPTAGDTQTRLSELNRRLMDEIGDLPGVTAVTQASRAPISGGNRLVPIGIDDAAPLAREGGEDKRPMAGYSYIEPNYFETLGIPFVSGRTFTVQEAETEAPVVIISEATARRFWPGQNPLGKRLVIGSVNGPAPYPGETAPYSPGSEVIGVVRDVHSLFLGKVDESYLYLPLSETKQWTSTLLVRTSGKASSMLPIIGSAVRRVDANLPVVVAPLDWMVSFDPYFVISRIGGVLTSIVGMLGLFLACLGVYGMVGYNVVQRTHEIGIRMALGARPPQVLGLVLRESARPMLYGTAIGIALSAAISRLLSAMLFGLNPMDAISFAGVSLLLIAVALFAGWLPARRAMQVDPLVALRYE
ncbi:MAG TPA: ABC transporter permease [Candidatus Acidoferrum sp.]|nr:ABC transporter permease [Candidatus Acidoferrum sp.]